MRNELAHRKRASTQLPFPFFLEAFFCIGSKGKKTTSVFYVVLEKYGGFNLSLNC